LQISFGFEKHIDLTPKSIANKIHGPICNLPENIRSTILDKFSEILPTKYVLLDWIDKNTLNWTTLYRNPNAIDLLENNQHKIDWAFLASNPNAIHLLKNNNIDINYQYWNELSKNLTIFKAV